MTGHLMTTASLTQARLMELLDYNQYTGEFTWRIHAGNRSANTLAGSINHRGYLDISVDGKNYRAHRLAWLYSYGNFPIGVIDHIDGDKLNNKLSNLRDVPNSKNLLAHRKLNGNNSSGMIGVHRNHKGWRAEITVGMQKIGLGTYDTPEEASIAYVAAKMFNEKKQWQGLTDEDWIIGKRSADYIAGAEWAEAKLKEKNSAT
jgi:hypothetical protein